MSDDEDADMHMLNNMGDVKNAPPPALHEHAGEQQLDRQVEHHDVVHPGDDLNRGSSAELLPNAPADDPNLR